MPELNVKKYGFKEEDEVIICSHCRRENIYRVRFHFENRPNKKNGHIVSPLELIATKVYDASPPLLCEKCKLLPICKDCEIILCNIKKHFNSWSATGNPNYCEACWDYKILIKI